MANEYLTRTPTSTGNRQTFTISFWTKNNQAGGNFFQQREDSNSTDQVSIQHRTPEDYLRVLVNDGGDVESLHDSLAVLRDFSGWQNIVVAFNTTIDLAEDRVKIYVNGVKRTDFNSDSHSDSPAQNFLTSVNHTVRALIGASRPNSSSTLNQYQTGQLSDYFLVDGQELTPDVFGFYKDNGYFSTGSTHATDFRPGQWVPKKPSVIKNSINNSGGFGVNGFYLPMNDSSNFGADFHCDPNTIITLQDETAPQPKNGAPTTTDSYVSQLRTDANASNLVLAVPGITGAPGVAYTDFSANIKGSGTNKVVTANGNAGVAVTASYYGSAMSFDGTGDYFTIPANTSDLIMGSNDFTIEAWVNKNDTNHGGIFGLYDNGNDRRSYLLYTDGSGDLTAIVSTDGTSSTNTMLGGSAATNLGTNQWHHCALEREGSYLRLYLNGVVAGIATDLSGSLYENTTDTPAIGIWFNSGAVNGDIDGYIQDLRVYKGVAKYKGGFDVSKPFTPVGIGTWREVPDTAGNNFATFNTIGSGLLDHDGDGNTSATYTNGSLTAVLADNAASARSTIGIHTGKWYWETRIDVNSNSCGVGIVGLTTQSSSYSDAEGVSYEPRSDRFRRAATTYFDGTDNKTDNGLIVGVALDKNVGIISFFADGQPLSSGTTTGINALSVYHLPECFTHNDGASNTFTVNYGQNPTFSGQVSVSSTQRNADANGKGQFRYAPPSGFLALCEDNLPTPAITDPGKYFKTVLWNGDGSVSRSITGVGFKPDFVWIKKRAGGTARSNQLFDSVRGGGYNLHSDSTNKEDFSTARLLSFDDDGFSIGDDDGTNASDGTYVAWCWQAGAGTTSSNTSGSINSVVSVNQDVGFSIVSYTGNGTSGTVGHGLGKTPNIVLCKNRIDSSNWSFNGNIGGLVYGTNKLVLQGDNPIINDTNEVTSANATTFTLGNSGATNGSSDAQIAYCWTEIEGFSKFGSYVGNGNADGPFVYCGFKPAWVMAKNADDSGGRDWGIQDSSRKSTNPCDKHLKANQNEVENSGLADTTFQIDLLSNGFKVRNNTGIWNNDGETIIFMAFAESPFKTANAI